MCNFWAAVCSFRFKYAKCGLNFAIYRLKKDIYGLGCVILIKVQSATLNLKCAHFDVDRCKYWLEVGFLHGLGKLLATVEKKN